MNGIFTCKACRESRQILLYCKPHGFTPRTPKYALCTVSNINRKQHNQLFSPPIENSTPSLNFTRPRTFYFGKVDYYKRDKIPKDYKIVYQAPMANYISWAQYSTILTGLGSLIPLYYFMSYSFFNNPNLPLNQYLENDTQWLFGTTVLLLSIAVVQLVIRRYVLRAYYYEKADQFILILPGLLPQIGNQLALKSGEMTGKLDDAFNLLSLKGQYAVHNRRVIIIERCFQTPHYLNLMLGHTKPE